MAIVSPSPIPTIIMFGAAGIGLIMITLMARYRSVNGMQSLIFMVAAGAVWSAFAAFEGISTTAEAKWLWSVLSYFGAATVPVLLFLFSYRYTGGVALKRSLPIALLFLIPLGTIALAATNPLHRLLWVTITIDPVSGQGVYEHGPAWWLFILYSYALIGAALTMLGRAARRFQGVYRRQVGVLMFIMTLPFAVNVMYAMGVVPIRGLEPTPAFLILSFSVLWYGLLRYRILDLIPIAREHLIDTLVDPMFVIDARSRLVDANPAACRLLQHGIHELIGMSVEEACSHHPQLQPHLEFTVDGGINHGSVHAPDVTVDLTLGAGVQQRHFELRMISFIRDVVGTGGILCILRDVTQRKEAEETLRQSSIALEERNRELDAFAHTVAHDLKAPISVLIGLADLINDDDAALDDKARHDAITQISARAQEMDGIIHSILLLASVRKLESLEMEVMNMRVCLDEVLLRLDPLINDVRAQLIVSPDWPTLPLYAPWVEEVWMNYINNALKYGGMPERGILPRVELGWTETDGMLRFSVRDNGPGISTALQSQLFEEFTRLAPRRAEGHGLGLSIVRRIVTRLNGTVGVTSRPGEGSEFWFMLPRG